MAFARVFMASFTGLLGLAALAAAPSCGGSDATTGPPAVADGGGLPDQVSVDSPPPPPPCTAPKTACGSACVDTSTDTRNCGACGTACKGPELCLASKCTYVAGFAARKVYLGETDRAGVSVAGAWKAYGRNIDGITTVPGTDNGECKRVAGASAASAGDGNDGIDNSFGRNVLGFLLGLTPNPTSTTNAALEAGGRTPLLVFGDAPKQTGVAPFALATAESTIAPKWDGRDSRPIAESSTAAGKPKTTFASATLSAGVLASGDGSAPFVLSFAFGGGAFDLPIRLARVSMTIAPDGKTATNGTLSGVMNTEELIASFEKVAGSISTQLCGGSTLDTIKQTMRQASDILVDGTQDPLKECNAISIGIGFDAVAVAVGAVAGPVAPPKDPCLP